MQSSFKIALPVTSDVENLSSKSENCMVFYFRVNVGHGTDGWTDGQGSHIITSCQVVITNENHGRIPGTCLAQATVATSSRSASFDSVTIVLSAQSARDASGAA